MRLLAEALSEKSIEQVCGVICLLAVLYFWYRIAKDAS